MMKMGEERVPRKVNRKEATRSPRKRCADTARACIENPEDVVGEGRDWGRDRKLWRTRLTT